ncbi:MAG: hypothetical protein R6U21_07770 [Thermoplasmatota archaeon]
MKMYKTLLILILLLSLIISVHAETIEIDIPVYDVTQSDGYDVISIPNGSSISIPGYPMLPYYIVHSWHSTEYEIQDITLIEKSGLIEQKGLDIKQYELQWGSETNEPISENVSAGWFPDQEFIWRTDENANDTTTLSLLIFPFFYNTTSQESKFYSQYRFQVNYVHSTVTIASLYTDQNVFDLNENVTVNLEIQSSDEQQHDLIISGEVKQNGKHIDYLTLRELKDFQTMGGVSLQWDAQDANWGIYELFVQIQDKNGIIYDRDVVSFTLGEPIINITDLFVNNNNFTIGDSVHFSAQIENTGDITLSGTCIVEIHSSKDKLETFQFPFKNLSAQEEKIFESKWDSSSAISNESYSLIGYVIHTGGASQIAKIEMNPHEKMQNQTPGFDYILLLLFVIGCFKKLIG